MLFSFSFKVNKVLIRKFLVPKQVRFNIDIVQSKHTTSITFWSASNVSTYGIVPQVFSERLPPDLYKPISENAGTVKIN